MVGFGMHIIVGYATFHLINYLKSKPNPIMGKLQPLPPPPSRLPNNQNYQNTLKI